ncbi:MAG: IPT/TIG domain-containing protein [Acidobacteriota bacterium]
MKKFRERKSWIVLIAVLLLFAACKGETPTAPPPGGGTPPGGTTPPTGVTLTVTTSKSDPLVDTSVTITATATLNGAPVPDGTAVEFASTGGSLSGSGTAILRTTTNGAVSVTLTNSAPGLIRVSAIVNNVTRTVDVTFLARPVVTPPPDATPTITSITPAIGRPAGGEVIRITGTNFKTPVHVLFDTGGPLPVEGSVVSVSPTLIEVITPSINLGSGQELAVDVIVLTEVGSTTEQRVALADGFTYRNVQLTPIISTVTPNSGPVTGNTRVTIIGEGFQDPVQVLFNTAEARVLNVTYSQILAESPAARDTSPNGSGTVTGPVTVTVKNIKSNTSATMDSGFLYKAAMQITAFGPGEGPFTGGTRVSIDGIGFLAPVAVSIGGVAAQPISVTGTRIIALTSGLPDATCSGGGGPVVVTNIVNGDTATSDTTFTYRVAKPTILTVSQNNVRGGNITITVLNAVGLPRLTLDDTNLNITGAVASGDSTIFTATVPTTLALATQACPAVAASVPIPTSFDVTYTSVTTGCTDTLTNGAIISPPANDPTITFVPAAFTPFSATITPATPDPDGVGPLLGTPASVAPSSPQTVTLTNTGTGTLTVNSVTPGPGCTNFTVSNPSTPASLEACDPFTISAFYNGMTTAGTEQCTVTVNTSDGSRTLTLVGTSQ